MHFSGLTLPVMQKLYRRGAEARGNSISSTSIPLNPRFKLFAVFARNSESLVLSGPGILASGFGLYLPLLNLFKPI